VARGRREEKGERGKNSPEPSMEDLGHRKERWPRGNLPAFEKGGVLNAAPSVSSVSEKEREGGREKSSCPQTPLRTKSRNSLKRMKKKDSHHRSQYQEKGGKGVKGRNLCARSQRTSDASRGRKGKHHFPAEGRGRVSHSFRLKAAATSGGEKKTCCFLHLWRGREGGQDATGAAGGKRVFRMAREKKASFTPSLRKR